MAIEINDHELMEQVKLGDKAAFDCLVIKHRASAVLFANSYVFDVYMAEDIVQDCFVKIYLKRLGYKVGTACFKTYLYSVIKNQCIDFLRKHQKQIIVDISGFLDVVALDATPSDLVMAQERQEMILAILNHLQGDYRTALYLLAVEEMSYQEIAHIMKKTVAQIKIIIYRGRKKIAKIYAKQEGYNETTKK